MKSSAAALILLLFFGVFAYPQEGEISSIDPSNIDSLFGDPPGEDPPEGSAGPENGTFPPEPQPNDEDEVDVLTTITEKDRVIVSASYDFLGGVSPGWNPAPWDGGDAEYSHVLGGKMEALLSLDFQISENLRVWNSFYFCIPDNTIFKLKEFYFDYNLNRILFIRAGQFNIAWGISRHFPYTNLPARIPANSSAGDSYIVKAELPIGIGGLQFVAMTRSGFMDDKANPALNEFAYGVKYNLAFSGADIDMGAFFYQKMPLRFFTSVKSTLGNTEVYAEAMAAFSHETWDGFNFSGSAGFLHDFFGTKLTVNGEVFYNGENGALWYREKTDARDAEVSPLIEGFNGAVNFIVRPGVLGMRIFSRILYSFEERAAHLVPGMSLKPGSTVTVTLTVPIVLGGPGTVYYRHNADTKNRPFSIMLGISIKGGFRYSI